MALSAPFALNLGPAPGQERSGLPGFVSHCPKLNDVGQPDPQRSALSAPTYVMCVAELATLASKHTNSQRLVTSNCKPKKLNSW